VRLSDGLLPAPDVDPGAVTITEGRSFNMPRRQMFELCGRGIPGFTPITVDSNDSATVIAGILGRMGRKLPRSDPCVLRKFKAFVAAYVEANYPVLTSLLSFEEWLSETNYSEARKKELRDCLHFNRGVCSYKDAQRVKSFVKTETYEDFKLPRLINSRCDLFKAITGPAFKSIEKVAYEDPCFVKHVPVKDRPALLLEMMRAGARYMVTDFTAFESGFTPAFMRSCELILYGHMLRNFPDIRRLICKTIPGVNKCSMRNGISYKVKGRRMSGDMCTSLGNGFANMMMFKFLMQGRDFKLLVEGDDGCAAIYDDGPLPTAEDYAKLGFSLKVEVVSNPGHSKFCGVFCEDGVGMRSPQSVFQKLEWSCHAVGASAKRKKALLAASALSLIHELPSCPVLRAYADNVLKRVGKVKPLFVDDGWHERRYDFDVPQFRESLAARSFFAESFGVSIEEQRFCEKRLLAGEDPSFLRHFFAPSPAMELADARFVT